MRSLLKTLALALSAAAITALAISCNSLLFVEVDEPEACLTLPEQQIPGAPTGTTELTHDDNFDFGEAIHGLRSASAQVSMRVLRAEVTATSGISNFDWVQSVVVQAVRPGTDGCADGSVEPIQVFSYQKAGATDRKLVIQGNEVEVAPHLNRGGLIFRTTFRGDPPPNGWGAEVKLCVAAKVRFDPRGLLQRGKGGPTCNPDGGGQTDGGESDGGSDGGQTDGGRPDGGSDGGSDGGTCAPPGDTCGGDTQCCGPASENICGSAGRCCHPDGFPCTVGNLNCCSGFCVLGKCGS